MIPEQINNRSLAVNNDLPFRYLYLTDFFTQDFYQELIDYRKTRTFKDAWFAQQYIEHPRPEWPATFFLRKPWFEYVKSVFDKPLEAETVLEFHHHKLLGQQGEPHTDLVNCFFAPFPNPDGINPSGYCDYKYGGEPGCFERVRGMTAIYYLDNAEWKEGDGGETILYRREGDSYEYTPLVAVPPISNSMLFFEVTPHSYHSFQTNVANERNSLIQFFHISRENADNLYGKENIMTWPR